jgi:hypothetical protein
MIRIDWVQEVEGVTVFRDDESRSTFYVIPNQPRYRIDDNGNPVFKFLKYRLPIDRPNGAKGGGFVIFDSEFVVPADKLKKVESALEDQLRREGIDEPVKFGVVTYTRGTAKLQLLDSGGLLVQKIQNPGSPSLFGHNITSFTCELSPEGATLCEQALQGKGGIAQVIYDLNFMVKLPPIAGRVWFSASKFASFFQKIDQDNSFWGDDTQTEVRRETFISSESGGVELDFNWALPDPDQDKKLKDSIRDWAWKTLEDGVKRMAITDPTIDTDKGLPDGMEHVSRDLSSWKLSSFERTFQENQAVEWHIVPQGTLPNVTSLQDGKGKAIQWNDYSAVVDLDDPFFKQLNVNVTVNADFQKLPIASVDVHLAYQHGATTKVQDFHLKSPDDVGKFATFIEANDWKYKYSYVVNYKGESRTFQAAEVTTDHTALTINVGDLGLLVVNGTTGDINFDQVRQAQVTITYDDAGGTIEEQFALDKASNKFSLQKLLGGPRDRPYHYKVKYVMADGRELLDDPKESSSEDLFINDPFSAVKTVGLRGLGNFDTDVDTIFVDLKYSDDKRQYTVTKSIALSKAQPFFDWSFPVINSAAGKVSYSGTIKFKNGTVEAIAPVEGAPDTILVGKLVADTLEISVAPDLIDWSAVKLVKVSLHYADPTNHVDVHKDFLLKQGAPAASWKVDLKDKTKNAYDWSATYFMNTQPASERQAHGTTSDTILVLETPAA